MKTGKTLAEFASQIKRTAEERKDFVTPTTQLRYEPDNGNGVVAFKAKDQTTNRVKAYEASPTNYCLRQICERSGIPSKYVDRMKGEHAGLLASNINYVEEQTRAKDASDPTEWQPLGTCLSQ